MRKSDAYTCLDLFAGAGGFSLGLEAAGFRLLAAVECSEVAAKTYVENFGEPPIARFGPKNGDILGIDPVDLKAELKDAGCEQLDLLGATPPCQGFSRIGRAKLDDLGKKSGAFLKDQRNELFRPAIAILQELRPRVFVFENVTGMLHLRGHNGVEAVCDAVAAAGYVVRVALLNSAWYGVPQTRERVFVIAVRKDLGIEPSFPPIEFEVELSRGHLSNARLDRKSWKNPEYLVPWEELPVSKENKAGVTVSQALDDLPAFTAHLESMANGKRYRALRERFPPCSYGSDPEHWYPRLMRHWDDSRVSQAVADHFCRWTPRDFETFRLMEPGDRYPSAVEVAEGLFKKAFASSRRRGAAPPEHDDFVPPYRVEDFPDKWRKLIPDSQSWTVTAHLRRDTYSHIHHDSQQARTISIRETARLQSFPDAFTFAGNMGDAFQQIGNAVPPLQGKAIGRTVRQLLEKVEGTSSQTNL